MRVAVTYGNRWSKARRVHLLTCPRLGNHYEVLGDDDLPAVYENCGTCRADVDDLIDFDTDHDTDPTGEP